MGIRNGKVVVGYRAPSVIPVLERAGIQWVLSDRYERGMLSSVLAGVRALGPEVDASFLLPVDIPLVKPRSLMAMLKAYRSSAAKVVYPCFRGVRGHPPLLATASIPADLAGDFPGGLRAFLSQYDQSAQKVEVADQAILMDCDTASDYARLERHAGREVISTEQECQVFWKQYQVPERVAAHSRMVAQVARLRGVLLNRAGRHLDLDLLVSGEILHDLAKGQSNHALKGSRILAESGCPGVARVVASHMDLIYRKGAVDEAALVYRADKLVDSDQLVSFGKRFDKGRKRFADSPEILKAVRRRRDTAKRIQRDVETVLGESLEQLLRLFKRSLKAVATGGERYIYLVRHGAIQERADGKRFVGKLDVPLSSEGIAQVRRLHDDLRDIQFSAVYCSDLKRSVETAAILSESRPDLVALQRPELREIDLGEWEGLGFEEVRRAHPEEFPQRGRDIDHCQPSGGESFLDCTKRVIPAFLDLLHTMRGSVLVVGHAGVNRIILCQVLGRSLAELFDLKQDYACVILIHYENRTFTARMLNGKTV